MRTVRHVCQVLPCCIVQAFAHLSLPRIVWKLVLVLLLQSQTETGLLSSILALLLQRTMLLQRDYCHSCYSMAATEHCADTMHTLSLEIYAATHSALPNAWTICIGQAKLLLLLWC